MRNPQFNKDEELVLEIRKVPALHRISYTLWHIPSNRPLGLSFRQQRVAKLAARAIIKWASSDFLSANPKVVASSLDIVHMSFYQSQALATDKTFIEDYYGSDAGKDFKRNRDNQEARESAISEIERDVILGDSSLAWVAVNSGGNELLPIFEEWNL